MKNYWKLREKSLFTDTYAYIDHNSYLADQLFIQDRIKVRYKEELARDNSPYCIVFCKVLRKEAARFEGALDKLENKMLLLGHKDYPEACLEIGKLIEAGI